MAAIKDVCAACRDDHEGLGHVTNRVSVNKKDADGCTVLHYACDRGHVDCCRVLIDHGASVNVQENEGVTPLYRASANGHVDCCKLLLENGASIDMQDNTGRTSLYTSCSNGHVDCCILLLEKGASINMQDNTGQTSLFTASLSGHVDCCSLLLGKGASLDTASKTGDTPLHAASHEGHIYCCRVLIEHGVPVNVQGDQGVTPLYWASANGHVDCCKFLLENGASIDMQDNTGEASLYTACSNGHVDCCKLLLKKGASIDMQDNTGRTSLFTASLSGHVDCCSLLLEKGASFDIPCETGDTPLHAASQEGYIDCCRVLIGHGAPVNVQEYQGVTPLYRASAEGHVDCCKLLLENGASIDMQTKAGQTSLWAACCTGHADCCKLLLEKGASTDIPCKSGNTCCYEVLLENGADPSLADSVRNGPIDIARSKGHLDIVRILEQYKANLAERNKRVVATKVSTSASAPISKLKKLKSFFKKSPRPNTSQVGTVICTNTTLCRLFIQSLDLKDAYFNPQYDVCFCESCYRQRGDNLYYSRGQPPKDYGLPIGWFKFGLVAPAKAAGEDAFKKWHIAFHGTRVDCVGQILKTGDLLMPGDFTPTGAFLKPPANHYDEENPKMKPPAGHDVSKIYLSPSIRYSGLEVYAPKSTYKDPRNGSICNARVAFQVRIEPGTYDVGDQTIGANAQIDPKIPNSELEWSTKRRGVTILVGLLVKMENPMTDPLFLDMSSLGPTLPQNLKF